MSIELDLHLTSEVFILFSGLSIHRKLSNKHLNNKLVTTNSLHP